MIEKGSNLRGVLGVDGYLTVSIFEPVLSPDIHMIRIYGWKIPRHYEFTWKFNSEFLHIS